MSRAPSCPVRTGASIGARWQALLAVVVILLVFTNAPRVAWDAGISPVPPYLVVALLAAGAAPLVFRPSTAQAVLRSPLLLWAAGYLALISFGYFIGSQTEVALGALLTAWVTALTLVLFLLIFADPVAIQAARRWMLCATLFAVAVNLYEVLNPRTFSHFLGRSAGFYLNPNISGGAIIYGLVLSVSVPRPAWRPWYALVAGLGVLTTLSRSSILCWVLVVGVLWIAGVIQPGWRMLLLVSGLCAGGLAALPRGTVAAAAELVETVGGNQIARLGVEGFQSVSTSLSVTSRARVAEKAWALFAERPLLGNGPGSTLEWSEDQSTHNMYLKFMAEDGILGLLIYPLALVAVLWRFPRGERPLALAFGVMWLGFGMFSHNEFEYRHVLVALALVAAMAVAGRARAPALRAGWDG